jgi:spermidine dehydrogenase
LKRDMLRARTDPRRYYEGEDVKRWLDTMSYEDYLVNVMGLDAGVARYIDPRMAAAIGLGCDVLSAYAAFQIGLPGMQGFRGGVPNRTLAAAPPGSTSFPGGNDAIARHIVKRLVPGAITGDRTFDEVMNNRVRFEALDRPGQRVRIRLGSTVVRVSERTGARGGGAVEIVYSKGGRLHLTRGRGVVMANGGWTSRHVVRDLPESYVRAFDDFVRAPILVVNVALHRWRFLYDQGITAVSYEDDFGFTCNVRQSMIVGRHHQPLHPDKPIVLTFYVSFPHAGKPLRDQASGARTEMLATSYRQYEMKIRSLMTRLFARNGFDARRDIAGIILNRWGHAYVCPAPGFYTGRDGKRAAPDVLREPLGRVAFANSELNGHQHYRIAMEEGWRAVRQVTKGV